MMKSIVVSFCLAAVSVAAQSPAPAVFSPQPENTSFRDKLVMYIPNRILDFTDIFSVETGLGYNAACKLYLTRACAFGANTGCFAASAKDYNRQLGTFTREGWSASFMTLNAENTMQDYTTGTIRPYWITTNGFPVPCQYIYKTGTRDYWSVGVDLGLIVNINLFIHPCAVWDFLAGLVFLDPAHNDLMLVPAQNCPD